uniref:Uncharacterized protein n=1 Tax=Arion vulgaris TaxID=1028688 RepID=A0A0B7BT31_9EUPU
MTAGVLWTNLPQTIQCVQLSRFTVPVFIVDNSAVNRRFKRNCVQNKYSFDNPQNDDPYS